MVTTGKEHKHVALGWQVVIRIKPLCSFILLIHILISVSRSEYGLSLLILNLESKV